MYIYICVCIVRGCYIFCAQRKYGDDNGDDYDNSNGVADGGNV